MAWKDKKIWPSIVRLSPDLFTHVVCTHICTYVQREWTRVWERCFFRHDWFAFRQTTHNARALIGMTWSWIINTKNQPWHSKSSLSIDHPYQTNTDWRLKSCVRASLSRLFDDDALRIFFPLHSWLGVTQFPYCNPKTLAGEKEKMSTYVSFKAAQIEFQDLLGSQVSVKE